MKYSLATLPYPYEAFEPYIDAQTMQIHHDKHHQAYIDKLNTVVEKNTSLQNKTLEDLMKNLDSLGLTDTDKNMFKNNGGGHLNHSFFWEIMGPQKEVDEQLMEKVKKTFGTVDAMKEEFNNNALNRFGSGWSWLVEDETGSLKLYSTPNQDSPYLQAHTPLIGIDVWEHAYYLKYQNKRADYIKAWWNVCKVL